MEVKLSEGDAYNTFEEHVHGFQLLYAKHKFRSRVQVLLLDRFLQIPSHQCRLTLNI
jgi:hypothetical protein